MSNDAAASGATGGVPSRRQRRSDRASGLAAYPDGAPRPEVAPRVRDGFSGLDSTGALTLDGSWALPPEDAAPPAPPPVTPAAVVISETSHWTAMPTGELPQAAPVTDPPAVPSNWRPSPATGASAAGPAGGAQLTVVDLTSFDAAEFDRADGSARGGTLPGGGSPGGLLSGGAAQPEQGGPAEAAYDEQDDDAAAPGLWNVEDAHLAGGHESGARAARRDDDAGSERGWDGGTPPSGYGPYAGLFDSYSADPTPAPMATTSAAAAEPGTASSAEPSADPAASAGDAAATTALPSLVGRMPRLRRPGADPRGAAIRLAEQAAEAGGTGLQHRILGSAPVSFAEAEESTPARTGWGRGRRGPRSAAASGATTNAATPLTPAQTPSAQEVVNAVEAQRASGQGRTGRNLPVAIGVGLVLGGAVLGSLLFRKELFVGVVMAAVVLAVWELATALIAKDIHIPFIPLAVGASGMLLSAYVAREEGLLVSFSLTAFGVLLWRVIDGVDDAAQDVAAAVFTAAYVPFLAGFAIIMLAAQDGAMRVIIFIACVVASDVGGLTAGVLFGRRPMAPSVSPKKSWEGFAGSVLLCMVVGAALVAVLLHGRWWVGLAVGAASAVTATVGDLSESLLKRDLGVKDMGNLLPGHGGMMDRLDSLLPTAPAVYLLLTLLVPPV